MFTKKSIFLLLSVLLCLLFLSGTVAARPPSAATNSAAPNTVFTYQGSLTDGDAPADGTYDFEFKLYTDISIGDQVASTNIIEGVPVSNGLFMVQLDFGPVFDGTMHYLEIGVRPGGSSDAYTTLSPRQALTAAPYATYAESESPQNVVIVAKSGGDFTSIQTALDSIDDANEANPYLVYVAPGVYNERVTMKPFVDIEGAGEHATRIKFTGSDFANQGTVMGANNAELRFLTVENTGGIRFAIAICNLSASPHLTHVTTITSGGIKDLDENIGVFNDASSPIMTNMTINVSGEKNNSGVDNYSSSPTMTNVTISAVGGGVNIGVRNNYSSATMTNMTVSTSGGLNIGIKNSTGSSESILVSNSKISGSNNTIINSNNYNVLVSASQLSGPIQLGGGTVTCIGVFDENFNITSCP